MLISPISNLHLSLFSFTAIKWQYNIDNETCLVAKMVACIFQISAKISTLFTRYLDIYPHPNWNGNITQGRFQSISPSTNNKNFLTPPVGFWGLFKHLILTLYQSWPNRSSRVTLIFNKGGISTHFSIRLMCGLRIWNVFTLKGKMNENLMHFHSFYTSFYLVYFNINAWKYDFNYFSPILWTFPFLVIRFDV